MSNAKKIVIVSHSHICRNPRVLKEAITLATEGNQVTVLTAIYSDKLLTEDLELIVNEGFNYEFYSDLRTSNTGTFVARLVRKIATKLQSGLHIESVLSLGYNSAKLWKRAIAHKADLYIMHQELPTCLGIKLIDRGYNVAFDLEDWYSEDLLPYARKNRPVKLLKKAESDALRRGIYCVTTSRALSDRLATKYSAKPPGVIYNVFPSPAQLPEKIKMNRPLKLFWFSQTIGPGRGLEGFISLLASVEYSLELHLLGNVAPDYQHNLKAMMPSNHQLFFHDLVNEKELAAKIATFDIGLALELQSPPNRNYTITNKFFQYLQAELPIIASETEGQNEGFEKFKPGFKISQIPDTKEIAKLNNWLNDLPAMEIARQQAVKSAAYYNWENESKKLITLVEKAFEPAG